jgi:hypothetical protein
MQNAMKKSPNDVYVSPSAVVGKLGLPIRQILAPTAGAIDVIIAA